MLINKQYFRMWVEDRKNKLQRRITNSEFQTDREMHEAKGQLDILREIYDDYNLEEVDNADVRILTDY